eukprot:TRINITY_DN23285_c0_g1_i1.p1 TRINITY_DN23285_c0_g1~~TRINITY_DN23285_c0_g1_i1.p1  ORF type:complete len:617 (+),score=115.30 TRINITY_DN23285_c0_g1_i1:75-1925(+)
MLRPAGAAAAAATAACASATVGAAVLRAPGMFISTRRRRRVPLRTLPLQAPPRPCRLLPPQLRRAAATSASSAALGDDARAADAAAEGRDLVQPGMRVKVHYRLEREDTGEVLDSTEASGGPVQFTTGKNEVFRGLDAAVQGLAPGVSRRHRLVGADGWGDRDEALVARFPAEKLSAGARVGDKVELQGAHGPARGRIMELDEQGAVVDFNHPLAGLPLVMVVTVLAAEVAGSMESSVQPLQSLAVRPRHERIAKLAEQGGERGRSRRTSVCAVCCEPARLRCSSCKDAFYCSSACATRHWDTLGHAETCALDPRDFQLDRVPAAECGGAVASVAFPEVKPEVFLATHCSEEGLPVLLRGAVRPEHLRALRDLEAVAELLGDATRVDVRYYRGVALDPDLWTDVGYCDSSNMLAGNFARLIRSGRAAEDDAYVNCDLVGTPAEQAPLGRMLKEDFGALAAHTGLCPTRALGEQLNIWWGAPGHTEPLHSDTNDGTLLQLRGRKKVLLFPASEWLNLYPFPPSSRMSSAWSRVSLSNIDVRSYPHVRQALPRRREVILEEGDALFIPACWAHQVTGLEGTEHVLSVNRFWQTSVERTTRWLLPEVAEEFRRSFPNGM